MYFKIMVTENDEYEGKFEGYFYLYNINYYVWYLWNCHIVFLIKRQYGIPRM